MISQKSRQHEIWDFRRHPMPASPVFTQMAKAGFHSFDFIGKTRAEGLRMIPSKLRILFQNLWFSIQTLPLNRRYKRRVCCRRKPSHNSPEIQARDQASSLII
jgi:hypothetical protein